jgi:hypothetical protein
MDFKVLPNLQAHYIDEDSKNEFKQRGIDITSDDSCQYCGLILDLEKLKKNFEIKMVHEYRKDGEV